MSLLECDQHLLVLICSMLDLRSMAAMRRANKHVHRLLSGDAFWAVVFQKRWSCPPPMRVARAAPRSWLDEIKERARLVQALDDPVPALTAADWTHLCAICEAEPASRAVLRGALAGGASRWPESMPEPVQAHRFVSLCMQGCGEEGDHIAALLIETLPWCQLPFESLEDLSQQYCAMLYFVADIRVASLWTRPPRPLACDGVARPWTGFFKLRGTTRPCPPMTLTLKATAQPDGSVAIGAVGGDAVGPFTLDGMLWPLQSGGRGGRLRKSYHTFGWQYSTWLRDGYLIGYWHGTVDFSYGGPFIFWPDDTDTD